MNAAQYVTIGVAALAIGCGVVIGVASMLMKKRLIPPDLWFALVLVLILALAALRYYGKMPAVWS